MITIFGSSDGPLSPSHRKGRGVSPPPSPFSLLLLLSFGLSALSLTISTLLSSFYPAVCDPHTALLLQSGRWYHSRLDLAPSVRPRQFVSPPSTRTLKSNVLDTQCLMSGILLWRSVEKPTLSRRSSVLNARVIRRGDTMWLCRNLGNLFECLSVHVSLWILVKTPDMWIKNESYRI